MKCLLKYEWVKLPRANIPTEKGIMAYWAKLAAHAAFRKGQALYCGYTNDLIPGMWAGGMVGLKKILGVRSREVALTILEELTRFGYITYDLNRETKKLYYYMTDWVCNCDGEASEGKTVYAIDSYGFVCAPRSLTERLVVAGYQFDESDAWLDLWCHSVSHEASNAFSHLAPVIQFGKYGAIVTLETLGNRWGWEKTKVWRFFKKHGDVFALYRLPGNYGCVLFNRLYPTGAVGVLPTQAQVVAVLESLRKCATRSSTDESSNAYINRIVTWYSRRLRVPVSKNDTKHNGKSRVALFDLIIRAYLSLCWNCKTCRYDCRSIWIYRVSVSTPPQGALCRSLSQKKRSKIWQPKRRYPPPKKPPKLRQCRKQLKPPILRRQSFSS